MARVTEPLASPSLSLRFSSFRIRRSYVLTRGRRRYHERDKSHFGGRAYTGNCFVLSHSLAESNTTQIYLQATPPLAHASTRARNFRTRAETHSPPISLEKCILHELSNLSLRVCRVCRIVSYKTRTCIGKQRKGLRDA